MKEKLPQPTFLVSRNWCRTRRSVSSWVPLSHTSMRVQRLFRGPVRQRLSIWYPRQLRNEKTIEALDASFSKPSMAFVFTPVSSFSSLFHLASRVTDTIRHTIKKNNLNEDFLISKRVNDRKRPLRSRPPRVDDGDERRKKRTFGVHGGERSKTLLTHSHHHTLSNQSIHYQTIASLLLLLLLNTCFGDGEGGGYSQELSRRKNGRNGQGSE